MLSLTDFNVSTYYDDFSEAKNFHRIFFKLAFVCTSKGTNTKSQTILQNQIEKFGDHVFKTGAMFITGQVSIDTSYYAIKLTSKCKFN